MVYTPVVHSEAGDNLRFALTQIPDFDGMPELFNDAIQGNVDPKSFTGAQQYTQIASTYNWLSTMDATAQSQYWGGLSMGMQNELAKMGYVPPAERGEDKGRGGLLGAVGDVFGAVADVADKVMPDQVQAGLMDTLGFGLKALTWVGDQPQHLVRAGHAMAEGNWNPIDALIETNNGEHYISKGSLNKAKEIIGGEGAIYEIAVLQAKKYSPEEIMEKLGLDKLDPTDRETFGRMMQYTQAPEYKAAVEELSRGKVSAGRLVARGIGLESGFLYNAISGGIDFGVAVYLDPTLQFGKWRKGVGFIGRFNKAPGKFSLASNKAFRNGEVASLIDNGLPDMRRAIDEMWDSKQAVHWWSKQTVGESVREAASEVGEQLARNPQKLYKRNRHASQLWDSMLGTQIRINGNAKSLQQHLIDVVAKHGELADDAARQAMRADLADVVKIAYKEGTVMSAFASGRMASRVRGQIELPYLSKASLKSGKWRDYLSRTHDFVAESDPKFWHRYGAAARNAEGLPPELRALFGPDIDAKDLALLPNLPLPDNITADDLTKLGVKAGDVLTADQLKYLQEMYPEHYAGYNRLGTGWARTEYEGNAFGQFLTYIPGARSAARFLKAARNRIPYDEIEQWSGKTVRLYGQGSGEQIRDFMQYGMFWGMPQAQIDDWTNAVMNAPRARRRMMVTSFLDTLFTKAGFRSTPEGQQFVDDYIKRVRQMYGVDDADQMVRGGERVASALDPTSQLSDLMAVPDLRGMMAVTRRHNLFKTIGYKINGDRHTALMNRFIKPGLVLRAAFLPRAAGEELVNHIFRRPGMIMHANRVKWAMQDVEIEELIVDGENYVGLTGRGLLPGFKAGFRVTNFVRQGRAARKASDPIERQIQKRWTEIRRAKLFDDARMGRLGGADVSYSLKWITDPLDPEVVRAAGYNPGLITPEGFTAFEARLNTMSGMTGRLMSHTEVRRAAWGADFLDNSIDGWFYTMNRRVQRMIRDGISGNPKVRNLLKSVPVLRLTAGLDPGTQIAGRRFFRNMMHYSAYQRAVVNGANMWVDHSDPDKGISIPGEPDKQYITVGSEFETVDHNSDYFGPMLFNRQREMMTSPWYYDTVELSYDFLHPDFVPRMQRELPEMLTQSHIVIKQRLAQGLDGDDMMERVLLHLRSALREDDTGQTLAFMSDMLYHADALGWTVDELPDRVAIHLSHLEAGGMGEYELGEIAQILDTWAGWVGGVTLGRDEFYQGNFLHWFLGNMTRGDAIRLTRDPGEVLERAIKNQESKFLNPENWDTVRKMDRFDTTSAGHRVARELADNEDVYYTPVIPLDRARAMVRGQLESDDLEVMAFLTNMTNQGNMPTRVAWLREYEDSLESLVPVPLTTSDPELAARIAAEFGSGDVGRVINPANSTPLATPKIVKFPEEFAISSDEDVLSLLETQFGQMNGDLYKAIHDGSFRWERVNVRGSAGARTVGTYSPNIHDLRRYEMLTGEEPMTQMGSRILTDEATGLRWTQPVWAPGVSHQAAARDMAERNVDAIRKLFGDIHDETNLVRYEAATQWMTKRYNQLTGRLEPMATLQSVRDTSGRLAQVVRGPKLKLVDPSEARPLWDRAVETNFKYIGDGIDSVVRSPMYMAHYLEAQEAAEAMWLHMNKSNELLDDLVDESVIARLDGDRMSKEFFYTRPGETYGPKWWASRGEGFEETPWVIDWHNVKMESFGDLAAVADDPRVRRLYLERTGEELNGLDTFFFTDSWGDVKDVRVAWDRYEKWDEFQRIVGEVDVRLQRVVNQGLPVRAPAWAEAPNPITFAEAELVFERMGWDKLSYQEFRNKVAGLERRALVPAEFRAFNEKDFLRVRQSVRMKQGMEETLGAVQGQYAMNMSTPFIDNNIYRSQFAEWGKNVFPFWFAEEQFLRRWGRTLLHSPEAFRKAQLALHGLQSAGLVRENPQNGELIFVMPGSALGPALLNKFNPLAQGERIPIAMPLTGKVKYLSPGLDAMGIPQFAPIPAWAVSEVKKLLPETAQDVVNPTLDRMTGDRGKNRSPIEYLVPSHMLKVYNALFEDPESNQIMSSAKIQAMQYMEANGLTPADDASAEEIEIYMERLQQWARSLAMTNAMYSFTMPSSASQGQYFARLDGPTSWVKAAVGVGLDELPTPEFTKYLSTMPYQDALALYIAENPDATPFTVFRNENVAGAPSSLSAAAGEYMDAHAEFFDAYDFAGPWFLPGPQRFGSDFEYETYARQVSFGWRLTNGPDEFYRKMKANSASAYYYEMRNKRDQDLAAAGSTEEKRAIRDQFSQWREGYLLMNPLFAEQLQSPESRIKVTSTIDQISAALLDPRLPNDPNTEMVRRLHRGYLNFMEGKSRLNTATAKGQEDLAALEDGYREWSLTLTNNNYQLRVLWESIYARSAGVDNE
jgi:hypothetical protein